MFKKSLLLTLLLALLVPWAANAQTVLLDEGFESMTDASYLTDNGYFTYSQSSCQFEVSTTEHNTGSTKSLLANSWDGSSGCIQILGLPTLSSPINKLEISFAYKSSSGTITLGYLTDDDYSTFTVLNTYSTSSSWTTTDYYNLSAVPTTATRIAIRFNSWWNFYVDDIIVRTQPTCVKPTGLAASLTPGNGTIATLNWTAGGTETNWVLEYGTTSDFTGATSVNVSGTPTKNLTGLTAETKYYARVKADCGGGDTSDWSATCEFTPTILLFINILGATSSTYSYLPSNTNYDYSYTQQIYTATEMGGFPCTLKSVAFKGDNAAVCDLDIYLANTTKSSFSGTSDYININDATLVFSGEVTFTANDWKTIAFDNEFDYEGGNIAVIVDDNSGNYDYNSTTWQTFNATGQALYFYQDNTNINPSSPSAGYKGTPSVKNQIKLGYVLPSPYQKPKNLAVTNITNNSATLTWEAPNSDVQSYKYQYREAGGSWSALTSTTALSAPLTSLTGNTTYEFQVQAIYAGNNESAFASTSFTTPCDAFSIDPTAYQYGFETADDMDCWELVNGVTNTAVWDNATLDYYFGYEPARTGDYCFMFYYVNYDDTDPEYQTLISPQLTDLPANGVHVEFYYVGDLGGSGQETFRVGYSTTDKNLSSFTWGTEITDASTAYQRFSANYPQGTKYVAVQHTSDNQYYLFLDDFTFEGAADCLEPSSVLADNITTTGASINWTAGGEEVAWDIYVTDDATIVPDDGTTPTYANISTKPYPLTGLTPATTYYVYVRAACKGTETSAWSTPAIFHTECEGMDLPYGPYGFEDGALSVCWNVINTNTSYNSVSVSASNANLGTHCLSFFRGHAIGDLVAVLPEVGAYDLSDYQFEFSAKGSYAGYEITIGIMTDPDDLTTFVAQGDVITTTTSYAEHKVRFNEYTGSGKYVAIKVVRPSTVTYGSIYVDDIAINPLPSCIEPTGLAASEVTNHTADLAWTGTSAGYNIDYRTAAYLNANDGGIDEDFTGLTSGIPTGWDNSEGTMTNNSYKWNYYATGHEGVGLRFNSYNASSGQTNFLKTPSMNFPAGKTMQLSFWWKNPTGGDFSVYISTDGGTTKTPLKEGLTGQSTWKQETINLTDYVGASNVTIHFKGTSNCGYGDAYIYLDEVVVGYEVAAGEWQHTTSTTATKTLSGLLPERKYDVRVQGNCGEQGLSEWSDIVSFTTDIACPAPTGLTASNPKSNSFDLQWTNGGSEDWVLAYKVDGAADFTEMDLNVSDVTEEAGTISYTLSGLDPETDYIVKVRDNCEASYVGDGMSEWTAEVPYSTIAACSAMNPVVSNVTHHNATVNFEGESATGFTVNYREAAHIDGIPEEFSSSSAPEGWTRYSGEWNSDGTGPTSTTTSGWSFGAKNFTNSHAYMNMYSDWKYWLVTPSITVGSNYEMNFDAAYTKYNATTTPDQTGTDDRFVILISTDNKAHWTSLREWNNAGTGDAVLNDLPVTFQPVDPIDLSAFNGQTVYIAFYGASTESNTDNHLRIDNVVIGVNVPAATTWQTQTATTTTADLTGLTAGTKYDVKVVPNCDPTQESSIVNFSTVSADNKWFITAGEWGTAANWEPTGAPTINQSVTLYANVTIENGCVAEAKTITQGTHTITIEDGGQLKHDNSGVTASVKKHIIGYGAGNTDTKLGYYLISNPLYQTIYKHTSASTPNISSTGMLTGTYDFYNWSNSNQGSEWRNYETSAFDMSYSMYSYLYANEADVDLTFTGTLRPSNSSVSRYVYNYSTSYTFGAWYLLGNPFVCNAYLVNASTSGTALPYYRMDAVNGTFEAVTSGPIAPMEGIFYEAETSGSVYMVRTAPTPSLSAGNGNLNINIAQVVNSRDAHRSTDNAIIRFDGGQQLGKFSFNENNAKVYIPQNGKDYAVVNAANEGEMPVYFKAAENGSYTISFTAEDVNFSYLHLIDNLTGNEVNLLETPSYSFDARTIDYASRFKLVFVTGQANMGDDFGFFDANGNLMILGIEGTATLQMIDVTGRIISSETFSGNYSKAINAKAGVYMLRLIQGNDVRTQKIVVR